MLFCSSKRAFSSMATATCFPFSAAAMSDLHDLRVRAGAVQRHLDRQHRRVLGRPAQEVEHRLERVVRVVEQDVALAQSRERVLGLGQRVVEVLDERRVVQVGPGQHRHRHQSGGAEDAGLLVEVVLLDLQLGEEELADALRRVWVNLQAHHRAELPSADLAVDGDQEVVRLLLHDLHVHVPGDPEREDAEDLHAREERIEVGGDERLQREELTGALVRRVRRRAGRAGRSGEGSPGPSPGRTGALRSPGPPPPPPATARDWR